MKTATRQMTWMTSKGGAVATITVKRGIDIATRKSDWGVVTKTEHVICNTVVSVSIIGIDAPFVGLPCVDPTLPSDKFAARIGTTMLAINHDTHKQMAALIADAKIEASTDADYVACMDRDEKAAKADAEYQTHRNAVLTAMAE